VIHLLDGNVLVALTIDSHVHHAAAHAWLEKKKRQFATCAMTQGTLLRLHMAMAKDKSAKAAWLTLQHVMRLSNHRFWDEGFSFNEVEHRHMQGPKQVTDAWLAALARRRRGKLATFDSSLAALHADVAECLPVE
jgi:toxin-antitoxin system PIN domain toxin